MKKHLKHKFRGLAALLAAAILAVAMAVPAAALEVPDLSKTGSITVTLKDKEKQKNLSGGELTLYLVADVAVDDGDYSFSFTNGFENCGLKLGDLSDSTLASQLESKLSDKADKVTRAVASDGTVTFADLPLGLYLLVQTKAADGYNPVSSFLVSVPLQENGSWIYAVDASPKVEGATPKPNTPSTPTTPNTPSKLPQTGQLVWPIPVLACAGLLLFAIGWRLRRAAEQSA